MAISSSSLLRRWYPNFIYVVILFFILKSAFLYIKILNSKLPLSTTFYLQYILVTKRNDLFEIAFRIYFWSLMKKLHIKYYEYNQLCYCPWQLHQEIDTLSFFRRSFRSDCIWKSCFWIYYYKIGIKWFKKIFKLLDLFRIPAWGVKLPFGFVEIFVDDLLAAY